MPPNADASHDRVETQSTEAAQAAEAEDQALSDQELAAAAGGISARFLSGSGGGGGGGNGGP